MFEEGSILYGKDGTYRIGKLVGKGGNGKVHEVTPIKCSDSIDTSIKYAVKCLKLYGRNSIKCRKRERFKREIENVLKIQNELDGIMYIVDCPSEFITDSDYWFIMPKAESYESNKLTLLQKLEDLIELGNTIKCLHDKGYAHRDIKPSNILKLNGHVYLSDFGLIWNKDIEKEELTGQNEFLGPIKIRPPEMRCDLRPSNLDYKSSDVYLYAKTAWIILMPDIQPFGEEYNRNDKRIAFDADLLQVATVEPLHKMMEGATKHEYAERITIEECVTHVMDQFRVLTNCIDERQLDALIFEERTAKNEMICADEKRYTNIDSIHVILKNTSNICNLVFEETGQVIVSLKYKNINIDGNIFVFEVINHFNAGRKKLICLSIKDVVMKSDKSYEISIDKIQLNSKEALIFSNIIDALKANEKQVYIDGKYRVLVKPFCFS